LRRERLYRKKKNKGDLAPSPIPSTSKKIFYKISKPGFIPGIGDVEVTEEEQTYGRDD